MNSNIKLIIISLVVSLGIIFGTAALLSATNKPVNRAEVGASSMTIDKKYADLGTMKADEEKTAVFTITNTGDSTLRLWNVATSCNCTFATVKIGEKETGEFNMPMHMSGSLRNWMGEVPAGKTAELKVIYRPKIMPVVGKVNRQVSFETNDPKNSKVEVTVEANVL